MRIWNTGLVAGAVAVLAISIGAGGADAGCKNCKPAGKTIVKTHYNHHTVQKVRNVTRYRDVTKVHNVTKVRNVTKNNYVNVVHRTVNVTHVQPVTRVHVVTRVRPVTRVNVVTRVHQQTVYQHSHQSVNQVVTLPARTVYSNATVMMPVRTITSHNTVHVDGGVRNVDCGCN
jgi:hypothetical protein